MPAYEMTFELPSLSDDVEDRVVETLDATVAEHLGVLTATVLVEAVDCATAARATIDALTAAGAPPVRLVDDLVSRSQIAERAAVSRQAVANWTAGARHVDSPFPSPFVLTGGGLWLWGEVRNYLRRIGSPIDDPAEYPTRAEAQHIAGMIASSRMAHA